MRFLSPLIFPMILVTFFACKKGDEPLRMYTSADPELVSKMQTAYEKQMGEHFEFVRMSTGEVLTRVRSEAAHPQAALWLVGPAVEFATAASYHLFEPYHPKLDFELSADAHAPDWSWTGVYFGAIGFASYKPYLEKNKLKPPTSWKDLLQPAFKGKVSYAYPYTSGTALMILMGVTTVMGEEAGLNFFKALDGQVQSYTKSGSASVSQVGLGEISVGIAFAQDIISKGIDKGYPIELSFPQEGTGYEISGVALLKNGTTPEKGKKFIDWVLSADGQTFFEQWHQTPFNPKVAIHPPTLRMGQVKLAKLDIPKASENQHRLVERWRKVTGK